jgi:hypothetical protein
MRTSSRLRTLLATFTLLALGAGCPAEEDPPEGGSSGEEASSGAEGSTGLGATSSEPSTSMGSDDSSGGERDPACDCVEGADDFVDFVCDADEICEPVQVSCAQEPLADCELTELTVDNPEVLECHHDALVDGSAGMLRWELPYVLDPGVAGQRTMLFVMEGRQAITWHEAWGAPSYAISDVAASDLRAAEHFDGCMALPSAEETFQCLFDATEGMVGVCVPAHEFPIG